ncbi:MAG TPA: helix-turn-helix transcriptional regulator, partial [Cyanobacteria bacterium UBA8543]|nr:helix-turn-helix transcriptional regulator [Cyanobacteria bacterium UBA8543]
MNGIVILTTNREIVYINNSAHRLFQQMNPGSLQASLVPKEIWHVCHSMIESRNLFPHQSWLIEAQVFTDSSVAVHIQVQWIQLEAVEEPCLLLLVTEQYQYLKNIALTEAQHYGLTSREKEIWLL